MSRLAALIGLFAALALVPRAAAQRPDQLDTPLLQANMCGAGTPGDVHFTLAATGDTFPHENIQAAGEANGYDYLFDHVRPFLQAADMAYTNFDGAMLEGSPYTGYPLFNFNPLLAPALRSAGINLVSTANNHILDRGPQGLDATLGVLAREGIMQHGAVSTAEAAGPRPPYLPITLSREGVSITIGFISATWGTNGIPDPYGQVNLLWESNSYGSQGGVRQSILDAIAQARRETDLVVVAAHWGQEYQFYPQPYQVEGARRMAEAGADVILGAQPHTLQPVDIIEAGGRKTLVIYSLANFLASQGAFQDTYFTATSVIFYVGVVRQADGGVRVTGYRYLPTIHVDGDTRPAPIPAGALEGVVGHVRLMMRDFGGDRQLPPDPSVGRVAVCPPAAFSEVPGVVLAGDFAQHYRTLGSGTMPREPRETIAALGLPLAPPGPAAAADCAGATTVLYTERQRLEWHPESSWPYRVVGAHLGVAAYRERYGRDPERPDPSSFADERFRAFHAAYGGVPVFGLPVSGGLTEPDPATGEPMTVQYFERARFELPPAAPGGDLLAQVRLAPLGREALARGEWCMAEPEGQEPAGLGAVEAGARSQEPEVRGQEAGRDGTLAAERDRLPAEGREAPGRAAQADAPAGGTTSGDRANASGTLPPAAVPSALFLLTALVLVGALGARSYRRFRRAGGTAAGRSGAEWRSWASDGPDADEELLRRLLEERR